MSCVVTHIPHVRLTESSLIVIDGDERAQPKQLYDPTHRLLAQVFAGEPVFPTGMFATPGWLKVLPITLPANITPLPQRKPQLDESTCTGCQSCFRAGFRVRVNL